MDSSFPQTLDRLRTTLMSDLRDDTVPSGLSADPGLALSRPPDGLLRLTPRVATPAYLRIELGVAPLPADTVLGLIACWHGPAEATIAARLETSLDGATHDVALGRFERLDLVRTQALFHEISPREPLTRPGARTVLVFDLPVCDGALTLRDIAGLHRRALSGPPVAGHSVARLVRSRPSG